MHVCWALYLQPDIAMCGKFCEGGLVCMCGGASLVPRLSPRTTMTNSKEEGESLAWYPFARDATEQASRIYISIGKFRRHSRADRPFSYSVYLRV